MALAELRKAFSGSECAGGFWGSKKRLGYRQLCFGRALNSVSAT